ncbi:hypothetical protein ABTD55_21230, partial [Acinetobacter baumannii]
PIVKVVAAVVVMAVPTALIEWSDAENSILGLAASIATGVGLYAGVALLIDRAGVRSALAGRLTYLRQRRGEV